MRFGKWKVISGQGSRPWILLKWISKEYDGGVSKYFDENLGATRRGKLLEKLENISFQEWLCYT